MNKEEKYDQLILCLTNIAQYNDNWDGKNGQPVTNQSYMGSLKFLNMLLFNNNINLDTRMPDTMTLDGEGNIQLTWINPLKIMTVIDQESMLVNGKVISYSDAKLSVSNSIKQKKLFEDIKISLIEKIGFWLIGKKYQLVDKKDINIDSIEYAKIFYLTNDRKLTLRILAKLGLKLLRLYDKDFYSNKTLIEANIPLSNYNQKYTAHVYEKIN